MNIDSILILRLLLYFIIYSFLGWVVESIFKSFLQREVVNSGFLHGPCCPIYGFGALIMHLFLSSFKSNIIILFFAGFFVLSIWEYIAGVILEKKFHTKYWDYSDNFMNIQGRVCLMNSFFWGFLGVIFTLFIHPFIESKVLLFSKEILIYLDVILSVLIIIDCIVTTIKVKSLNMQFEKVKEMSETIKEKLKELKNIGSDKIEVKKNMEKLIDELKQKQEFAKYKIYKQARRLKFAFPTMKSESITKILNQKIDFSKIKKSVKERVNKRNKEE